MGKLSDLLLDRSLHLVEANSNQQP
jgi:hypothetical protein